jgi:hypothetical protein
VWWQLLLHHISCANDLRGNVAKHIIAVGISYGGCIVPRYTFPLSKKDGGISCKLRNVFAFILNFVDGSMQFGGQVTTKLGIVVNEQYRMSDPDLGAKYAAKPDPKIILSDKQHCISDLNADSA